MAFCSRWKSGKLLGSLICLLYFIFVPAWAIEGTVLLSNGKSCSGKLSLSRALQFDDLFTKKPVFLALSQVFRIIVWEQTTIFAIPSQQSDTPDAIATPALEKRYVMGVTTWTGESYWGYFHCRITVKEKHRERKFIIAPVQVARNIPFSDLYHVKEVICQPAPSGNIPAADQLLYLCGVIKPGKAFRRIYAVHQTLGLIIAGKIFPEQNWYEIRDILPGNYDLVVVGETEVLFAFTPPERKHIMDKEVNEFSSDFMTWIEGQPSQDGQDRIKRRLLYLVGQRSDTRAILAEDNQSTANTDAEAPRIIGARRFWLCLCSYRHEQWQINNFQLLLQQDSDKAWPNFLIAPELGNVELSSQGGKQQHDLVWGSE